MLKKLAAPIVIPFLVLSLAAIYGQGCGGSGSSTGTGGKAGGTGGKAGTGGSATAVARHRRQPAAPAARPPTRATGTGPSDGHDGHRRRGRRRDRHRRRNRRRRPAPAARRATARRHDATDGTEPASSRTTDAHGGRCGTNVSVRRRTVLSIPATARRRSRWTRQPAPSPSHGTFRPHRRGLGAHIQDWRPAGSNAAVTSAHGRSTLRLTRPLASDTFSGSGTLTTWAWTAARARSPA